MTVADADIVETNRLASINRIRPKIVDRRFRKNTGVAHHTTRASEQDSTPRSTGESSSAAFRISEQSMGNCPMLQNYLQESSKESGSVMMFLGTRGGGNVGREDNGGSTQT